MELVTPQELGLQLTVEEDGSTFLANAMKKAKEGARISGLPTLADDSGLEVPALGGRPGVRSARFAGPGASGKELVQALLQALGPQAQSSPVAYFKCAAVVVLHDGRTFEGEGVLQGTVAGQPRGSGGFGYDPIFALPDGRRLAELSLEEKNLVSHRARALAALEVAGAFDAALSA